MELLIFVEQKNERIDYVFDFIFSQIIGCSFSITTDMDVYRKHYGAKLNYSITNLVQDEFQLRPHSLLFESDIREQTIEVFSWKKLPAFFGDKHELVPFDIFAASFFLLSRYEEYNCIETDAYGRFPHKKSLAFQYNFLHLPLIDLWALELRKILKDQFPLLEFSERSFKFIPTYDIDIAFSYLHKGRWRNIGGFFRDIFQGKFIKALNRVEVLRGGELDPFDCYAYLNELHRRFRLEPIYFFLLGSGGPFDKNISPNGDGLKKLVRSIASLYRIGIHPSYRSNEQQEELAIEIERLNNIANIQTTLSRQHYIKFELPQTYVALIKNGLKEDYSMGYGSINGFRASTCTPHVWFNLPNNKPEPLTLYPFCFMECNSFYEQKQDVQTTLKEINHYIQITRQVDGCLITIWHNFSLGSDKLWSGWKEVYDEQIAILNK